MCYISAPLTHAALAVFMMNPGFQVSFNMDDGWSMLHDGWRPWCKINEWGSMSGEQKEVEKTKQAWRSSLYVAYVRRVCLLCSVLSTDCSSLVSLLGAWAFKPENVQTPSFLFCEMRSTWSIRISKKSSKRSITNAWRGFWIWQWSPIIYRTYATTKRTILYLGSTTFATVEARSECNQLLNQPTKPLLSQKRMVVNVW
jgi:hypothetical protein